MRTAAFHCWRLLFLHHMLMDHVCVCVFVLCMAGTLLLLVRPRPQKCSVMRASARLRPSVTQVCCHKVFTRTRAHTHEERDFFLCVCVFCACLVCFVCASLLMAASPPTNHRHHQASVRPSPCRQRRLRATRTRPPSPSLRCVQAITSSPCPLPTQSLCLYGRQRMQEREKERERGVVHFDAYV